MSDAIAPYMPTTLSGYELLTDPQLNKDMAFSEAERDAFDLHGLLPPNGSTLDEQMSRAFQAPRQFETDLERYAFLRELQDTVGALREVAAKVALAVALQAHQEGYAADVPVDQIHQRIHAKIWIPRYVPFEASRT